MKAFFLVLILFVLLQPEASSQFYNAGQSPGKLRWQKIETPFFEIVFPAGYDSTAQLFAYYLETAYPRVANHINSPLIRIPVVIHNQGMRSNGFVSWAPKRVELFPLSSQQRLSVDYKQHLSLHELRHVAQMSSLNRYATASLGYVFGQQITGALAGLYLPLWFLEGDAVCAETALTASGRGRNPAFTNKLRAQLIEKGKYSYEKAKFGSYKDFVPNHYELGYFLTAHGRTYYSRDIWPEALDKVARRPWALYPFAQAIRKHTSLNKSAYYEAAMDSLYTDWKKHIASLPQTYAAKLLPPKNDYADYARPALLNDSTLVSVKRSFSDLDKAVLIDIQNGGQTLLRPAGRIYPSTLSAHGNHIYYIEHTPDKRWQHRSSNNVVKQDVRNGKRVRLTQKGRYQTAVVSPDGRLLACVHADLHGRHSLHLLCSDNGLKKDIMNGFHSIEIIDPAWVDNKTIVFIAASQEGKAIALIDTESQEVHIVKDFDYTEIGTPTVYYDFIIFTSSFSGINNIYAWDISERQKYLLTSSNFGNSNAVVDAKGGRLIYLNLSALGNTLVQTPLDSLLWIPEEAITVFQDRMLDSLTVQEGGAIQFNAEPDTLYEVVAYSKLRHFFNFHSWAPLYVNVDKNTVNPGAVLFSQNLLSTATSHFGYEYDIHTEQGAFVAGIDYEGWYPIISSNFKYGKTTMRYDADTDLLYQELTVSGGVNVPFRWQRAHYMRHLNIFAHNNLLQLKPEQGKDTLADIQINTMDYGFIISNRRLMAMRDIHPAFSQSLMFRYAHSPLGSKQKAGDVWGARLNLFFPGLLKHHSLYMQLNYQERARKDILLNFLFPIARGHNTRDDFFKTAFTLQFNYALPLFYPDWAIGPIAYIKRFKANIFYDYTETLNEVHYLRSYGLELNAHTHLFRFVAPITLGLRFTYNHNRQSLFAEPLFKIDFNAL